MYRALIGDREGAIHALERGFEARSPMMVQLAMVPWFEPLRRAPRVTALLQQMQLPLNPPT